MINDNIKDNDNLICQRIKFGDLFNATGDKLTTLANKPWVLSKGQRLYSWQEKQVTELIEDVKYVVDSNGKIKNYSLQTIKVSESNDAVKILDGQQRLTTSYILKIVLMILKYDSIIKDTSFEENTSFKETNTYDSNEKISILHENIVSLIHILKINNKSENYKYQIEIAAMYFENGDIDRLKKLFDELVIKFEEEVYKCKIKINIFLPKDKLIMNLFYTEEKNESKIFETVKFLSKALNSTYYEKEIENILMEVLGVDEKLDLKNCTLYLNNFFMNLRTIYKQLKTIIGSDINELIKYENTVNEVFNFEFSSLGYIEVEEEIKNFTNINTRGLRLDFSDQFKSWYLETSLHVRNDNSRDTLFKNIEDFFDKIYKEYDIIWNNNKNLAIINDALVHTINLYSYYSTYWIEVERNGIW